MHTRRDFDNTMIRQTQETMSCSANDKSANSFGTLPIHLPLASAILGIFPLTSDAWHVLHTLSRPSSTIGPSMSWIASLEADRSFCVTPGFVKMVKSSFSFDRFSKFIHMVNLPQTAHPDSEKLLGDICSQAPDIILCCSSDVGIGGGNAGNLFET